MAQRRTGARRSTKAAAGSAARALPLEPGDSPELLALVEQPLDVSNLAACTEDARRAALETDPGPADPVRYDELLGRLQAARASLPPLYREAFYRPLLKVLDELGPSGFERLLSSDPERSRAAGLVLDAAHAVLQNGERYEPQATDGFQEVVSDLYDGFLSAEDRRDVKPPDRGVVPPLVKWGNPRFGPYAWPVDATSSVLGLEAGIVSLPPAHARSGLFAWAALGHETAGHEILHADIGLPEELADAVHRALSARRFGALAGYWADRIDETASDVAGILNMGPAAGIGLVGYFRALNAAFAGEARLRSEGPASDPHPADVLRGYLAAATVARLEFRRAQDWSRLIARETDRDAAPLVLAGQRVSRAVAQESADAVAETLVRERIHALDGHALGQIQNWRNADEARVRQLGRLLAAGSTTLTPSLAAGTYAAHGVAGAVVAALASGADLARIFQAMVRLLARMHEGNPSWGPLHVRYPGDVVPHLAYPARLERPPGTREMAPS